MGRLTDPSDHEACNSYVRCATDPTRRRVPWLDTREAVEVVTLFTSERMLLPVSGALRGSPEMAVDHATARSWKGD